MHPARASLRVGKVPMRILQRSILPFRGRRRRDVVLWPRFGEDAGAFRSGEETLVIACDPITGSRGLVGWLSVHLNANDVAVCGAQPRWFSSCILMPRGSSEPDFAAVARQIDRAAKSIGVAVVTGHSEVAPYAREPIVVGHMTGPLITDRLITSSDAKRGDLILMAKTAALEGTAILATDKPDLLRKKGVDQKTIRKARSYYKLISVVHEASLLASSNAVNAMHDPTEGGVLGGLYELAEASGCGFRVYEERIPVSDVTERICRAIRIDHLKLISSGVLLATASKIGQGLLRRAGLRIIGQILPEREGMTLVGRSRAVRVNEPVSDELWRLME